MAIENLYVQYGCWKDSPEGWVNFDCSPYLVVSKIPLIGNHICGLMQKNWTNFPRSVRFGDIVKGLPMPDNSCDGVYCSHVLEHLALSDFRIALHNTNKILKEGGTFRLVLPDLAYYINEYISGEFKDNSLLFIEKTGLGAQTSQKSLVSLLKGYFGNSRHQWMWDFECLKTELKNTGFVNIKRADFGDSDINEFQKVERKNRWENCLGIECKKSIRNSI